MLSKEEIINNIINKYHGLVVRQNWGETGIFYNPENKLKKGIYLLTFKEKDGANDKSSNLNRDNTFRLNLGISNETFINLFGKIPSRPSAGNIINMGYDFSVINEIIPHPVYGWMNWVCVINPTNRTFEKLVSLIDEGYKLALKKYENKKENRCVN